MATVRQVIDESWQRFVEILDQVPDHRIEEPGACGDWSVKDLMAHVAFWDDHAVAVSDALGAGREPEPLDWQAANEREAARRSNWTLQQCRREMEAAHQRLLDAVERHPDLASEVWREDTFEHYSEHVDDIEAWLAGA